MKDPQKQNPKQRSKAEEEGPRDLIGKPRENKSEDEATQRISQKHSGKSREKGHCSITQYHGSKSDVEVPQDGTRKLRSKSVETSPNGTRRHRSKPVKLKKQEDKSRIDVQDINLDHSLLVSTPKSPNDIARLHIMEQQNSARAEQSMRLEKEPSNRRRLYDADDMFTLFQWSKIQLTDEKLETERKSHAGHRRRFSMKRRLPVNIASLFSSTDKDAPVVTSTDGRSWFFRRLSLGGGKKNAQTNFYSSMYDIGAEDDDDVGLLSTFNSSEEAYPSSKPTRQVRRGSLLQFFGGRRLSTGSISTIARSNMRNQTAVTVCMDMDSLTSSP